MGKEVHRSRSIYDTFHSTSTSVSVSFFHTLLTLFTRPWNSHGSAPSVEGVTRRSEDERPARLLRVSDFRIGVVPVLAVVSGVRKVSFGMISGGIFGEI